MAILAMIVHEPVVSGFQAETVAVFFDDADEANVGYLTGEEPRNILFRGKYDFTPPLTGAAYQSQVKAAIKADRQKVQDAYDLAVAAHGLLPVGALIDVNS